MVFSFFAKRRFPLALILLLSFFLQAPAGAQQDPDELAAIDAEVQRFLRRWNIPGATVALAKNDKLLYAKGFGMADEEVEMDPNKLFRIASLSKPLTAMAVMKLAEDDGNNLTLESKVFGPEGILHSEVYADLRDPRMADITVQNLLEHTAGWNRETSPEGDPMFGSIKIADAMGVPAPADAVTIIRYMLQQPLDFTPGTQFSYSNLGYSILGRIIEEVAQLPYEAYVRQAVLQPLGITNMFLGRNLYEDKNRQEVRYFDLQERKVKPVTNEGKKVAFPYGGFNLEAMDAHGGWIASAPDLIKLLLALDAEQPNPLLKREQINQMATPSEASRNYGKGWFVNPKGNMWHTGALVGTSSLMAHLNNGFKWVLLFNARPESPAYYPELDRLMWNAVSKVETWPDRNLFEPQETQLALEEVPQVQ